MNFLSIIILMIPSIALGQQTNLHTIVAQGDYDTSTDMSLSWTLGEYFTETVIIEDFVITQGFQQPNIEISKLNETDEKTIAASLFPNPTQGMLTLQMAAVTGKYRVEIIDITGRILSGKWHHDANVLLDLTGFPSGQYVVRIANSTAKKHASFSVLKF